MRTKRRRLSVAAGRLGLAILLILVWEVGAAKNLLDPFYFSRPSSIAARVMLWVTSGSIWPHIVTTFAEAMASFILGSSVGVVLGFLLARSPFIASILDPHIRIANSLPRVVLAPIFLLWFGLGIWSKIALGFTVVVFVVFFNAFRGVREADPIIIDNVRMLGASERQLTRHVLLPSALSWIFSSLHISIGLAVIAVVVGEYMGASRGIGYLIALAEGTFDTTGVFAGMTVLAIGVLLVGAVVNQVEHRLLRWKPQHNRLPDEFS